MPKQRVVWHSPVVWFSFCQAQIQVHSTGRVAEHSNLFHLQDDIKDDYETKIQGVPKKTLDSVWWAIEGTRSGLETKVGWVLKNSGNFLSDEHKNSSFLSENVWEKWGQRRQPPLRKGMIVNHPEDIFLCSNLKDKIDW